MKKRVCIIEGIRTPFAKAGANLQGVPAAELGRSLVSEIIDRASRPGFNVDALVFGNIIGPADSANIARVIALKSNLPITTPAYTVNMNCASGMLSIAQGCDLILSGQAKTVIAGGTESMSNAPLQFPKEMSLFLERWMRAKSLPQRLAVLSQFRLGHLKPVITLMLGLTDPVSGLIMGETAEVLAKRYKISRDEQDTFALRSHQNYFKGLRAGFYDNQILPLHVPPKFKETLSSDVGPRDNLTIEQLGKLKPFFDRRYGTVTVGNSCPITDGAAAVLLMEESEARKLGYKPAAIVRGYGFQGVAPEIMGLGPAVATPLAMQQAGISFSDIQRIEINEAFAAQIIANMRVFESPQLYKELTGQSNSPLKAIDPNILNVNGGAIALGHPVGCSGTRIVINLMNELRQSQKNIGLASICVGGGLGGAIIIEADAEAA